MDKFDRQYRLLVQKKDGSFLEVKRPFTVEFDIHRNSLSSANVAQIRIYNISPNNRNQIRKNQYDYDDNRTIQFFAGYGDQLSLAFTGNISQAWSVREGSNIVTTIESFDGGYAYVNAITGEPFKAGTPQRAIVDSLAGSLGTVNDKPSGISIGAIGTIENTTTRGNSYDGNTLEVLSQVTGNRVFIDNHKVNCLSDTECLGGTIPIISAQTGLLGTPVREQTFINLEMLFEPSIVVAQLVKLQAVSEQGLNGVHKVLSIHHRGTISEAVCGTAVTSLGLLPGTFTPIPSAS